MVQWETGETSFEFLNLIAKGDPFTCAAYAKHFSSGMPTPPRDSSQQQNNPGSGKSGHLSGTSLGTKFPSTL